MLERIWNMCLVLIILRNCLRIQTIRDTFLGVVLEYLNLGHLNWFSGTCQRAIKLHRTSKAAEYYSQRWFTGSYWFWNRHFKTGEDGLYEEISLLLGGKKEQYPPHYWFSDRYFSVQGQAVRKRLHLVEDENRA